MNDTIAYYDRNAEQFSADTAGVEFSSVQDRFLRQVPAGGRILDFGCGTGRDTRYFLEKGYRAEAVDGSEAMCRTAEKLTGTKVRQMLFSELDAADAYDGIWACASILHLDRKALLPVFRKMAAAVHPEGVIYISFKYGTFEGERNGRYFTDLTEDGLAELLDRDTGLGIAEAWISGDVRPGRENEKWLNAFLRRK